MYSIRLGKRKLHRRDEMARVLVRSSAQQSTARTAWKKEQETRTRAS